MTNNEIIYKALQAKGFSEDQLTQLMQAFRGDLPFHTFAEWKARGYYVRKGEKAFLAVPLWKYTDRPNMAARKAAEEAGEEINPDPHYYKKMSYIFGFNQVEKAGAKKNNAPQVVAVQAVNENKPLMLPTVYKPECTALAVI